MYRIECDGKTLHDMRDEKYMLLSPKVSLELNKTGNLDFGILSTHPEIGSIRKLHSRISVYDDEELLYVGRPTTDEADFYNYGQVSCEGGLAFLLDSIQRPKERGRAYNFEPISTNIEVFRAVINEHNIQVEASKKFEIGIIDIESASVENFDANYEKTWDLLVSKFTTVYEGYLRVRYEGNVRYIDYVKQFGKESGQEIRFGENLLDLKRYIKADNIATAIIPLGKSNVTIKNANGHNGSDYIYDSKAVGLYGWIYQKIDFSEVNDPDTLYEKAKEYLKKCINLAVTIELTAIDLHLIDIDIDCIKLGDTVRVVSPLHGLDRNMMVSKREYNLSNPSADKITLGDTLSFLTEKQVGLQREIAQQRNATASQEEIRENVGNLNNKVDAAHTGISMMGGKVEQLGTDFSSITVELQEVKNSIANLTQTSTKMNQSISEILVRLETLEEGGETNA